MASKKKNDFKAQMDASMEFINTARRASIAPTQQQPAPVQPEPKGKGKGKGKDSQTPPPQVPDVETKIPSPADDLPVTYEQLFMDGIGPHKRERKTRRVNFVFQPSLYEAIQRAASKLDMSPNDFCSQVLKKYLQERGILDGQDAAES